MSQAAGWVRGSTQAKPMPNYVIYKSGSTLYAFNNDTGINDYSNSEIGALMNSLLTGITVSTVIYFNFDVATQSTKIQDQGKNNVRIFGRGKYLTKLDITTDITGMEITSISGWILEDFEIDGNDNQTTGKLGVYFEGCIDCEINLYIHHISNDATGTNAYGIYIYDCTRVYARKCDIRECDHGGGIIAASPSGNSYDCDFIDCYGYNNADKTKTAQSAHFVIFGYDATHRCYNCNIINCKGDTSGNWGAQLYRYLTECYIESGDYVDSDNGGLSVCHGSYYNSCEGIGAIGVKVRRTTSLGVGEGISVFQNNAIIKNNTIINYAFQIVIEEEAIGCVVEGNICRCQDISAKFGIGVRGDHTEVVNNTLDVDYCGISVNASSGTADKNVIKNNIFYDNEYPIYVHNATKTEIEGNTFYNTQMKDIHLNTNATSTRIGMNIYSFATSILDQGIDTKYPEIEGKIDIGLASVAMGDGWGVNLPNNADTTTRINFILPSDFVGLVRCRILVIPSASGDMAYSVATDFGKRGVEVYTTHSDSKALGVQAVTLNEIEAIDVDDALTGITAEDFILMSILWDRDDASDTSEGDAKLVGAFMQIVRGIV